MAPTTKYDFPPDKNRGVWKEKHRLWQIIQLMELRKCIVPNDE